MLHMVHGTWYMVHGTWHMVHSNLWKPPSSLEVTVSASIQVSCLVASRLQAGDKHCMARIAQFFALSYLALHTQFAPMLKGSNASIVTKKPPWNWIPSKKEDTIGLNTCEAAYGLYWT